jgi:hypothetical protein
MHLFIQNIRSLPSEDFVSQLKSCLSQIQLNSINKKRKRRIVKITVFSLCRGNADFILKQEILNDVISQSEEYQAPSSLVSQPPVDCETMIEVWSLDYSSTEHTFTFTLGEQSSVLLIECPDYSCLFSAQYSAKLETFKENTIEAFEQLDSILRSNGFDYSEIVRQWNYIENINNVDTDSDLHLQNYQIFNDVRSLFYKKSDFIKGYPSATGIGNNMVVVQLKR